MQNPQHAKYHGYNLLTASFRAMRGKVAVLALATIGVGSLHAGQLSLTWQDNSDNEDGFEIERSLLGESFGVLTAVGPDSEAFVDESIMPGKEYEYRVRAYNAFGYSGYTNVSVGMIPNTAPTIDELANISVLKGEPLPVAEFSFSDAESDASELVVEALSSNLALVPLDGISVDLSDGVGRVSFAPLSATGKATVTLMVSDGVEIAQREFEVEILKNLAPTIGTLSALDVFDSQQIGPIAFTISDSETAAADLTVVGDSLDESLIATDSISISGSGANRTVSFATQAGVSGTTTIRLAVSDGVNTTNGALRVNIAQNAAPILNGLEDRYTIEGDGTLNALAFTVSDRETSVGQLEISVRSSNSLIVSPLGLKVSGTGNARTLDVTPNSGMTGSIEITVSVSDGTHVVERSFELRVIAPEQVVKILGFTIEQSLAVVEVENRENATFTLWKIHSIDGAWQQVEDAEVIVDGESTTLVDPSPIDAAVCYRVLASE